MRRCTVQLPVARLVFLLIPRDSQRKCAGVGYVAPCIVGNISRLNQPALSCFEDVTFFDETFSTTGRIFSSHWHAKLRKKIVARSDKFEATRGGAIGRDQKQSEATRRRNLNRKCVSTLNDDGVIGGNRVHHGRGRADFSGWQNLSGHTHRPT